MSETKNKTREISVAIDIHASPEQVWSALAEGPEIEKWFAPEARVTPGEGGSIFISWGEGMQSEEPITKWDPPRHLRYRAGEDVRTKTPIWVDWHVEAKDGGTTTLRMVQSGFSETEGWDDELDSLSRGWNIFLENIRHYLERHRGAATTSAVFTARSPLDREAFWDALLRGLDRDGALADKKPGDTYRITTSAGDVLSGTVQILTRPDLALSVDELGDALLRVSLEKSSKPETKTFVYGIVIAYGKDAASAAGLAGRLEPIVAAVS